MNKLTLEQRQKIYHLVTEIYFLPVVLTVISIAVLVTGVLKTLTITLLSTSLIIHIIVILKMRNKLKKDEAEANGHGNTNSGKDSSGSEHTENGKQ
jgi:hypothetical protein